MGQKPKMKNKISKLTVLLCAGLFEINVIADLDEKGFEFYQLGELSGQCDWMPQGMNDGYTGYEDKARRLEVKRSEDKKNQWIEFKAGFVGKDNTRLIKKFPATSGKKAVVSFDFKPGADSLGGRLYFEQMNAGGANLQFIKGSLYVLEKDKQVETDTGIKFKIDSFNHFDMLFDFERKTYEIFLDGVLVGKFALADKMTQLDQLNLFAGSKDNPSCLDNLVIKSVEEFPKTVTEKK